MLSCLGILWVDFICFSGNKNVRYACLLIFLFPLIHRSEICIEKGIQLLYFHVRLDDLYM